MLASLLRFYGLFGWVPRGTVHRRWTTNRCHSADAVRARRTTSDIPHLDDPRGMGTVESWSRELPAAERSVRLTRVGHRSVQRCPGLACPSTSTSQRQWPARPCPGDSAAVYRHPVYRSPQTTVVVKDFQRHTASASPPGGGGVAGAARVVAVYPGRHPGYSWGTRPGPINGIGRTSEARCCEGC